MRFHVVNLPHTQTTKEFLPCAYTQKVRNFCRMMMSLGHEVFLYGSEENDAPCTEFITCIRKDEQRPNDWRKDFFSVELGPGRSLLENNESSGDYRDSQKGTANGLYLLDRRGLSKAYFRRLSKNLLG